jgi:hypothetical protein
MLHCSGHVSCTNEDKSAIMPGNVTNVFLYACIIIYNTIDIHISQVVPLRFLTTFFLDTVSNYESPVILCGPISLVTFNLG